MTSTSIETKLIARKAVELQQQEIVHNSYIILPPNLESYFHFSPSDSPFGELKVSFWFDRLLEATPNLSHLLETVKDKIPQPENVVANMENLFANPEVLKYLRTLSVFLDPVLTNLVESGQITSQQLNLLTESMIKSDELITPLISAEEMKFLYQFHSDTGKNQTPEMRV